MKLQLAALALVLGSSSVLATDIKLVNADGSALSGLCIAALTSKEEFARLKDSHFPGIAVEREIVCNGLPLNQFVRRYQNRLASLESSVTAAL